MMYQPGFYAFVLEVTSGRETIAEVVSNVTVDRPMTDQQIVQSILSTVGFVAPADAQYRIALKRR